MATQQQDMDTYGIPDPDELLTEQQASYAQAQARGGMGAMVAAGAGGLQAFNGGGQQMQTARAVQARMKSIMQGANEGADPNEDPLSKQLRIATAMSTGLIDVSPKAAMAANDRVVQLQQAQTQQKLLNTKIAGEEQETAKSKQQIDLQNKLGTIVFARPGEPDANGMPTGMTAAGTVDASDPDYAAKVSQLQADAKAGGYQIMPMTGQQFFNSKDTSAATRAQAMYAAAQMKVQEQLQIAAQKAQNNPVNARFIGQASRVMGGADMAVADLQNIVELPIGASTGTFGIGKSPGHSLMQATQDTLKNALSPQDVQSYNVYTAGLQRNLAAIEATGLMPQGSLVQAMDSVVARSGDTERTRLEKLAQARQIIENGTRVIMHNPNIPQEMKDDVQRSLDTLSQTIPFTIRDVQRLDKSPKGTTIQDIINQKLSNTVVGATYETEAEAQAAADSGKIKAGDRIKVGGKAGVWQ